MLIINIKHLVHLSGLNISFETLKFRHFVSISADLTLGLRSHFQTNSLVEISRYHSTWLSSTGASIFQKVKPRKTVLCQAKRGNQLSIFDQSVAQKMTEDMDECDVQICRLMKPDDANIAGNVHGGTILKMIEEAGIIASTRHCNSSTHQDKEYEPSASALVRVETTDFLQPMYIGELAELRGKVTYTAPHSVEVKVMVTAENLLKGTKRFTNFATLWYVPMSVQVKGKVLPAPPLTYKSKKDEEEGRLRYEAQKAERRRIGLGGRPSLLIKSDVNGETDSSGKLSVSYSRSSLIHLIGPSDCNSFGNATGGVTMKLMDEVAGCVAARHCRTNIVTASMDATNFHKIVRLGDLCHLTGRPTFTSNRSLEIEVMVDKEYLMDGSSVKERAVHAFFTYVSLGPDGKTQEIPQLEVQTEGEKIRFEEGKLRYEQRKQKRAAKKQTKH